MEEISWYMWLGNALLLIVLSKIVSPVLDSFGRGVKAWHTRSYWEDWEGKRYIYHLTIRCGKPLLVKSTWIVSRHIFGGLRVEFYQQGTNVSYVGRMHRDGNHVIVLFQSKKFSEFNVWRLSDPLPSKMEEIYGIFLSYDHDKHIAAAGVLISKEELEEREAMTKIQSKVGSPPNIPILHVNTRA